MTNHSDLIDAETLKTLVAAGECRVIDCRHDLFNADKGPADYAAGHVPGAVYAHMDDDLASAKTRESGRHPLPDVGVFIGTLRQWGINNDTQVVVCDYGNGALAVRLWWMLRFWLGHENAAVLDGGLAAWIDAGGELTSEVSSHKEGNFSGQANAACVATTGEIAAAVAGERELHLVDARDPARFRGEVEPIDPVAGHVPGARNLPLTANLADDGQHWRQPSELESIWHDFLADGPAAPPVVMCGSGVTACHLVLSACLAGLEPPRLYVGSWSEWVRDQNRPVGTENSPS